MNILVVDDEVASRKVMARIMSAFGQCQAVDSGNAALEAFMEALQRCQPFDLVTLDVIMPGKDGLETLLDMREMESALSHAPGKRAVIFMVTSVSHKDSMVTAVQAGCDDYLIKPVDKYLVPQKLAKFGLLTPQEPTSPTDPANQAEPEPRPAAASPPAKEKLDLGLEIMRKFKSGEISLPTPPGLFVKFHQLIKAGAGLNELANVLKQDAAVSFRLIGVSNSPFYRAQGETKTLDQALNRLGLETTCKFVYALSSRSICVSVAKKYEGQINALWKYALVCAHATELLAGSLGLTLRQDPFTLGLFHEIGKLLLLRIVAELEKEGTLGASLDSAEVANTLEAYSGQFGAVLLKKWGFAPEYSQVARHHADLTKADPLTPELLVVHAARALARTVPGDKAPEELAALLELESACRLKLDLPLLQKIREQLLQRMEEADSVMG